MRSDPLPGDSYVYFNMDDGFVSATCIGKQVDGHVMHLNMMLYTSYDQTIKFETWRSYSPGDHVFISPWHQL